MKRVKKVNYSWLTERVFEGLLRIDDYIDYEKSIVNALNDKLEELSKQKAIAIYRNLDDEVLFITNNYAEIKAQANLRQGRIEGAKVAFDFLNNAICRKDDNE